MNFYIPNKISTAFVFILFSAASCSRSGCVDKDAENYEPKAKVDCACCFYGGKAIVWYGKGFYEKMQSSGVTSLNYFANNELVGQLTGYIPYYSLSAPTLASNNSDYSYYTKEDKNVMIVNLGNSKIKKFDVRITDQNQKLLWFDSLTFIANHIVTIGL